jgi:hypothetical protein
MHVRLSALRSQYSRESSFLRKNIHISPNHWKEWVDGSGVDQEIVKNNLRTISKGDGTETECQLYEIFGPKTRHEINGHILNSEQKKLFYIWNDSSGWVTQGINLFTGERADYYRIKLDPDSQKLKAHKGFDPKKGKTRKAPKYVNPQGEPSQATLLEPSFKIWEAIAKKHKLTISEADIKKGFWPWVLEHTKVEIFITEGEKKAGALLTKNLTAISIPGIWNGRRYKDKEKKTGEHLIPELNALASEGRKISIIFDSDKKESTIKQVDNAQVRLAALLKEKGAKVYIGKIPNQSAEKMGIDDYFVSGGEFKKIKFIPSDKYKKEEDLKREIEIKERALNIYKQGRQIKADITINKKYFNIEIEPGTNLIIKSGTGTGKTEWIKKITEKATIHRNKEGEIIDVYEGGQFADKGINSIGARNSLMRNISERVDDGKHLQDEQCFGDIDDLLSRLFFCADSLKRFSNTPQEVYEDKILMLDEITETIAHTLQSKHTHIATDRLECIRQLRRMLTEHLVTIALDANADNYILEYLKATTNKKIIVIENNYKKERPKVEITSHPIFTKNDSTKKKNAKLHRNEALEIGLKTLEKEGKVLISTTTQELGEAIDNLLKGKNYKVLRIDSKTITKGENALALLFLKNPIKFIKTYGNSYDCIIFSPTMQSGVDIGEEANGYFDLFLHFGSSFLPINTQIQMISRLRDPKVRLIIAWNDNTYHNNTRIKAITPEGYLKEQRKKAKIDARMTVNNSPVDGDFFLNMFKKDQLEPEARYNAAIESRRNIEIKYGRDCLKIALEDNGFNDIVELSLEEDNNWKAKIRDAREEIREEEANNVLKAEDIDIERMQLLLEKKGELTRTELFELVKAKTKQIYPGISESNIWGKDFLKIFLFERGYLKEIENEYILRNENLFHEKQRKKWINQATEKKKFIGDLNLNESMKMRVYFALKEDILSLTEEKGTLTREDPRIQRIFTEIKERKSIQEAIGIISPKDPIKTINNILNNIGFTLKSNGRKWKSNGPRLRDYIVQEKEKKLENFRKIILSCLSRRSETESDKRYEFDLEWKKVKDLFLEARKLIQQGLESSPHCKNFLLNNTAQYGLEIWEKIEGKMIDIELPQVQNLKKAKKETETKNYHWPSQAIAPDKNEKIKQILIQGYSCKEKAIQWLTSLINDYGWENLKMAAIKANLGALLQKIIREVFEIDTFDFKEKYS